MAPCCAAQRCPFPLAGDCRADILCILATDAESDVRSAVVGQLAAGTVAFESVGAGELHLNDPPNRVLGAARWFRASPLELSDM